MQTLLVTNRVLWLGLFVSILPAVADAQSATKSQLGSKNFGATAANRFRSANSASRFSTSNITSSVRRQAVSPVGVLGVNQKNFLGGNSLSRLGSSSSKPFSGVSRGPAVSPYLALSAPRASASDYQSIIRPQQQQARANRRQQAAAYQQQRRLNQLAARGPYSTTGNENRAPTGHVAVFQSLGSYQNTGSYFPPPSPGKKQR